MDERNISEPARHPPLDLYLEYWSGESRIAIVGDDTPAFLLPALKTCGSLLSATGDECRDWISASAPQVLARTAERFREVIRSEELAVLLAEDCRMSVEMFHEAVGNFFPGLTEPALAALQKQAGAGAGGGGESSKVLPPALVFHVPAGNLFLSAIESVIHATLCGSCSLVRCPASGSKAIRLWLRCMEEVDAPFSRIIAHGRWPRTASALTRTATAAADAVVVFGSDDSVAEVRELTPVSVAFVPHGSRLSFAILGEEAVDGTDDEVRSLAAALAYDFTVYDQQGCLSPRAAFLQTTAPETVQRWACLLHEAMDALARRLPPPVLSLEETAALARVRDDAAVEAALGGEETLFSGPTDPFVITAGPASSYRPGCLNRHVDLRTFTTPDELRMTLLPFRGQISTLGIAKAEWGDEMARHVRASRICPVGMMQKPPLNRIHDGHPPLTPLLCWVGIETADADAAP